jgi:hypothetical protein
VQIHDAKVEPALDAARGIAKLLRQGQRRRSAAALVRVASVMAENRYLVLGLGAGQAADIAVPPGRDELIAYGPLLSDDGSTWLGTAVLARARDPDAARAILTPDRYADIEVHSWQFGGRPS